MNEDEKLLKEVKKMAIKACDVFINSATKAKKKIDNTNDSSVVLTSMCELMDDIKSLEL
jgi:hypothetical protein